MHRIILTMLGVTPPRHRKPGRPSMRPTRPAARDAGSARPVLLILAVLAALVAGFVLPAGTGAILAVGLVAVGVLVVHMAAAVKRTVDGARQGGAR
jgi:hypothetical protein